MTAIVRVLPTTRTPFSRSAPRSSAIRSRKPRFAPEPGLGFRRDDRVVVSDPGAEVDRHLVEPIALTSRGACLARDSREDRDEELSRELADCRRNPIEVSVRHSRQTFYDQVRPPLGSRPIDDRTCGDERDLRRERVWHRILLVRRHGCRLDARVGRDGLGPAAGNEHECTNTYERKSWRACGARAVHPNLPSDSARDFEPVVILELRLGNQRKNNSRGDNASGNLMVRWPVSQWPFPRTGTAQSALTVEPGASKAHHRRSLDDTVESHLGFGPLSLH